MRCKQFLAVNRRASKRRLPPTYNSEDILK
jgi:hypothetical protein